MKILHATKKYPDAIGGDAVVVSSLEDEQHMGHEVFILTSRCPEIITKDNVFMFGIFDKSSGLDRIGFKRILSLLILSVTGFFLLKRIKPDIIHSHSPDIGFILSFQALFFKIPVINTCHGVTFSNRQFSSFKGYLEILLLKLGRFEKIVTVDGNSLPDLSEKIAKDAIYIPNGVDIEYFKKESNEMNNHLEARFLFTGRLEEQKGLPYLIQASKKLSGEISDFKVVIVGDGSMYNELNGMVKNSGLGDKIEFTGRVDNERLRFLYHSSDIFVLPSVWEGMPLTLLEAWACGLPVIVTDVGDISRICVDKENAIIVSPKDPDALYDAMLMLARDKQLREKLGKSGENTVAGYSWHDVMMKYMDVYRSVIDQS
ncbi:glycosyltransferase family 4 protein [Methanolacinia paynteri]|uniref:glycosyltransferase family 4 protein n=1 Tax=Methanolacinia paynteri TaxID=230356 RepID=UPI00064E6B31|nr:glycosyltransferase family 4 protein [Methanolacinia paynteri]